MKMDSCYHEHLHSAKENPVTLISMWPEQYDPTQSPQLSHDDTHSRIEQYANRLAHMERTNGSLFTDSSSTTGSV
nr:PREDICTED: utrophin-like isoform X2 [Latimeria chalumnae]|eukprot:XP_006014215.1 PREDICTED: utrophin-like isoform X2 [Latimeria chalumnae]